MLEQEKVMALLGTLQNMETRMVGDDQQRERVRVNSQLDEWKELEVKGQNS